jgi:hypothetical protein
VFFGACDEVLDFRLERGLLCLMRVGNDSAHDGDPLDDLRDALQRQQGEADRDQRFGRPLRQPAGAERLLVEMNEFRKKAPR